MLGLPDRESNPEEVDDDDDDNGLKRLFWIPPDVESPPSGLRPSSSTPKPPPPAPEPVSSTPAPEPPSPAPAPEPRRSKRTLSIPGQYTVLGSVRLELGPHLYNVGVEPDACEPGR
jgi:cell division septation protein DedD